MPGYLDRHRAARLMAEQGLDALVLAQPESIKYATGAFPGVATYWRRAGAAFVVVPQDGPMTAIVGDLQVEAFKQQSQIDDVRSHRIWVETGHFDRQSDDPGNVARALVNRDVAMGKRVREPRPAQYDMSASVGLLRDALAERGLLKARIGFELGFVAARDMAIFNNVMPEVSWVDATNLVERLRAIKASKEIEYLRTAAELSRAGVIALVEAIAPGMDAAGMTEIWRERGPWRRQALAACRRQHQHGPTSPSVVMALRPGAPQRRAISSR